MRRYQHQPDQTWIERNYAFHKGGVEDIRRTVERSARQQGKVTVFDRAIRKVFQAVSCGWGLGDPVDQLRPWLVEAAGWVDEALERGREVDEGLAEWFLATAVLASAWPVASRVAAMVPDHVVGLEASDPVSRQYLAGLAALIRGDLETAAAAAEAMGAAQGDRTVPPHVIDAYAHLDELIAAAAARDAPALAEAIEHRSAALARQYGASIEDRRKEHGLLDLRGTAVVACAVAAGIRPETTTDYIAVDLVAGD
ncbi:MAG: hypothetical protein KY458_10275 [Actinobacteria bacterium]|nr:hypothetical protein [Actinomycetota bacterium]